MNTRRHPARTTLSCLACLALAGSDVRPRGAANEIDSGAPEHDGFLDADVFGARAEHDPVQEALDAAIAASRSEGELASGGAPASARRILELAALRGTALDPRVRALIEDCAPFLAHLPLAHLVAVESSARELCLHFAVPASGVLEVQVPEVEQVALATSDDPDASALARAGVPVRVRSDARTLLVHERLRLELDDGRIVGVRDGDLEVAVGPFEVDVDLSTERGPARAARDGRGRTLLALDAAGHPRRENGRWVPQTYELWIVLEALGQRVEVGVPLGSPVERD